jgi:peptide/nickel transport system permease protein
MTPSALLAAPASMSGTRVARRWRQTPRSFRVGTVILVVHVAVALLGPFVVPYGPAQMGAGPPLAGVDWGHPFGTDMLGRDVFSRVVHGGHIVLLMSIAGTALGLAVGSILGLVSAYVRGWVDEVVMRLVEALISIPYLVLALLIVTVAGPTFAGNPLLVVAVVAFVYAPRVARMARAAGLDLVSRDFVTAAQLRGESVWSIVHRELLPNATGTLFVEFAIRAGYAPVLVGSLGFLGFGIRPPTPEWGLMISENRELLLVAPMTVLGPGLVLASLVVGLNLWTEGIARILGRTVRVGEQ